MEAAALLHPVGLAGHPWGLWLPPRGPSGRNTPRSSQLLPGAVSQPCFSLTCRRMRRPCQVQRRITKRELFTGVNEHKSPFPQVGPASRTGVRADDHPLPGNSTAESYFAESQGRFH